MKKNTLAESKNFRKLDLKVEMEGDLLISMGIVFHDLVPAYLTDFIPYCIVLFLQQNHHP